jgi:nucleoside-diphosphate-sugar epimerase
LRLVALSPMQKTGVIINVSAGAASNQEVAEAVRVAFGRHGVQPRVEVASGKKLRETARATL